MIEQRLLAPAHTLRRCQPGRHERPDYASAPLATDVRAAVRLHTPAIVADAEALLKVLAWRDLPGGVRILPRLGRHKCDGVAIGSGHLLATAYGCRHEAVAVQVDVARILKEAIGQHLEHAETLAMAMVPVVEHVAIHELAHALTASRDPVVTRAAARAIVATIQKRPPARDAAAHGPRWAAALAILSARSLAVRPADSRPCRQKLIQRDLAYHGLDPAAIAAAVAGVPDDASLRELLAPAGQLAATLAAACPSADEQQALIDSRRRHGADGDQ